MSVCVVVYSTDNKEEKRVTPNNSHVFKQDHNNEWNRQQERVNITEASTCASVTLQRG